METDINKISSDVKQSFILMRESTVLMSMRLLSLEILFGLIFFIAVVVISFLSTYIEISNVISTYLLILAILLLLNMIIAASLVLKWQFEYVEVNDSGVTKHSGILHRREEKYACHFIEVITTDQSFMGTLFNYGSLVLYDPALKDEIHIMNVTDPKKSGETIQEIVSTKDSSQSIPFIAPHDSATPTAPN